jgi:hypothetical protein
MTGRRGRAPGVEGEERISEGNRWIPWRVRDDAIGRGGRPQPPVLCETTSRVSLKRSGMRWSIAALHRCLRDLGERGAARRGEEGSLKGNYGNWRPL